MTSEERIVAWLREASGALSGEELARRLGCSRAAVWKRIGALRRAGYRIDGRRADGYTLAATPDRLGPPELGPHLRGAWRRIHWLEDVDSTQRVARELARKGAPEGTTVVAERQSAGRGRLGRQWHSPAGVNLYCSIVLRPPLAPVAVPQIALVVGAAVAAAIADETGRAPAIKWPNDVLLDGRNVAGIGVNLNAPLASFPRDLREKAGSLLSLTGRRVDRAAFTGRLLAALEARYGRYLSVGLSSVRAEWESFSCLTGTEVCVASPEGEVSGRALGLDDDGALRLRRPDGRVVRVISGEVTVRDGYRAPGA